jgi:predicted enzyme related to lactoylglutathione lyase
MNIGNITFDCANPARLAEFWAHALGWQVEPLSPDLARIVASRPDLVGARASVVDPIHRGTRLWFQRVPETKQVKNRMHLDCDAGRSRDAEIQRLEQLGARVVKTVTEQLGEFTGTHVVMTDPEGNEFCLR